MPIVGSRESRATAVESKLRDSGGAEASATRNDELERKRAPCWLHAVTLINCVTEMREIG
jgi:hypothetical protein